MRKILFYLAFTAAGLPVAAQTYESIKNQIALTQYEKAKEDIDKAIQNRTFTAKPEAFILKAVIYAALSMDRGVKNTPAGDQLALAGDAAFTKYKEMDPAMGLLSDLVYQNGAIDLYSNFYSSGYNDYSLKKWDNSYAKLKKAVQYSDLLMMKQLLKVSIDTNVLILAGITAEKSKHKDEAAGYYSRLADKKITGDGFESVYRFLVSYNFGIKNYTAFEKYKAIGITLYPDSEFFQFDEVDFSVGLAVSLNEKIKALDEIMAGEPNNYKANEWMGEIIYRAFYPLKDDLPESFDSMALESKMIAAFNKAGQLQPDSIDAFLYLGDHFYNKSEKIGDQLRGQNNPDKTKLLNKQYENAMENQLSPYKKAAAIFAKKTTLTIREKGQYRNLTGKIADIYTYKKVQAKDNPDEKAKYQAAEKLWNDLYETIK